MALWNHAEKTLYTKIVYYGPAFGGKTTNLESLHRLTDPAGDHRLLSVKTADDRTLFFDLLPVELGDLLGYQVAMKVYTVPGQVRYDATRKVVLSGADAVVFVADSSTGREEQNRWSLQNLHMHMRALGLDHASVPVVFQFNKQDLSEAAPPDVVASWLRLAPGEGQPAVAIDNRGVIDTFVRAGRAMLAQLVQHADDRTRRHIDLADLDTSLEAAFERFRRQAAAAEPAGERIPVVVGDDDIQQSAVQAGVRLGEELTAQAASASRLEREVDALRALADAMRAVGANFDPGDIVESGLSTLQSVLEASGAALIRIQDGRLGVERSVPAEGPPPLPEGAADLVARVAQGSRVAVVDDLSREIGPATARPGVRPQAAVLAPVDDARVIVAWSAAVEREFTAADVRFVATVAGQVAAGLERARLHRKLADHGEELEGRVERRTAQLRQAYRDLQSLDEMKDRFLNGLSHEMKSPLTAIIGSATFLRDYQGDEAQRAELVESIVTSGERLAEHLDSLFRLVGLDGAPEPFSFTVTDAATVVDEAAQLADRDDVRIRVHSHVPPFAADEPRLARALANLIDNAYKFSPDGAEVEVEVALDEGSSLVVLAVRDRGPGIAHADRERIFAPFEQGGDPLTGKPDGVGLGLHEARTIAARHGGRLECRERDGGGAEFRLTVPLAAVGREPAHA